jgi:hypothetical protein
MANRINTFLLKRSNIPGKIPSPGQLLLGEIALNSADAMLYTSGTTANSILPIGWDRISRTGDTMSGTLYAPSISATTYLNLPISIVNISNLFSTGLIDTGTNVDSITYSNFFGEGAGSSALYASDSNFFGYQAGYEATNANDSNFIGHQAGYEATNANDSNFIGTHAGYGATNAHNSNFIGNEAGNNAISASDSNFMGHFAGYGATNAYNSNFIGKSAGHEAINAHQSNFIGNEAGANADNADFSNFMGQLAGGFAINAGHSNFIGQYAGYQATDASYSNFLGYNAGNGGVLGSLGPNNIIIGTNISLSAGTIDSINLGGVLFGTGTYSDITGNPSIVAQTGGKIGINVVNPLEALHVNGNTLVGGNLTANTISATTYYNLPLDVKVTGSSFNTSTYDLTLTRNDGVTITSNLAILSSDMVVTGGTYNINTGVVTFTNNSGGTFNVTGFTSGMTDTYTTGGTVSNGTATFTKSNGVAYSVSGFATTFTGGTVSGATIFTNGLTTNTISATTYYNLPLDIRVTGGTYSAGTAIFSNNTGGTFSVTGLTTPFTGGTVIGSTLFTNGLTANTFSATSINRVDYMIFNTGTTSASTVPGTIYFDNTEKALSYNTSLNQGVTVNLGQQNYLRVYNNSGIDIQRGKALELLTAYSGLPAVTLALNRQDGNNVIGISSEFIPNGSEGIAIINGIISNITLTGMSVGSLVYASDTTPGELADATKYFSFPLTARTNQIGYVVQTGVTTGKLFLDINNENTRLSLTDLERNVLEGNTISTGLFEFTGMTTASTTTFNVAPLKGWLVKNTYTYALTPDVQSVNYTGGTNIPVTNIASADSTYILINSATTITQQVTFPTPQQRRENIFLGKVNHPNRVSILNINNTADYDVSPMSSLRDLWSPIKLINQGIIPSPNGANLSFNTSAGILWGNGINWHNNQLSPNDVNISAKVPASFFYRTRTGGTSSSVTVIDPTKYDVGGVITSVGAANSDDATNQRIYLYPTGVINVLYGQTRYANLAAAIAAIQSESFIPYPNAESTGILIGVISVRNDIVADGQPLTNTNYAKFTLVSKFGESFGGTGGLSTTTLQQAYDNSTNPEIVINAVLDGLSIQNGTGNADNVTRLLEGVNAAANATSFIRADGYISGTTLQTNGFIGNSNGITATTVSATTYLNLPTDIRVTGGTYSTGTAVFTNNTGGTFSVTGFSTSTGNGTTFTGGTVTGSTIFTNGLSANTFSATTYLGLPTDIRVTGGTYSSGTTVFINNTGGTFSVTGFSIGNEYWSGGTGLNSVVQSNSNSLAGGKGALAGGSGNSANSQYSIALGINSMADGFEILPVKTQKTVVSGITMTSSDPYYGSYAVVFAGVDVYSEWYNYFYGPYGSESLFVIDDGVGNTYTLYYYTLTDIYNDGLDTYIVDTNIPLTSYITISGSSFYALPTIFATPAFVFGSNSLVSGGNSIVLGNNITGTSDNTTYVDYFNIKRFKNNNIIFGTDAGSGATNANDSNFFGYWTGKGATNAQNSNFIGPYAGQNSTNASGSNFFGYNAGYQATSAQYSNFLGSLAGYQATSAQYSNFLGSLAGYLATNAQYSNFFGREAGYVATLASYSNFLGFSAGRGATNASYSNFFGQQAGFGATNANNSNFMGFQAGLNATGASGSNFFGWQAGQSATNASTSNFMGFQAGLNATGASGSNFMGYQAGLNATGANNSNFLGYFAGYLATNAYTSNFLGNSAGYQATSATYSNFFGNAAGYQATSANNSNFIGNQAGRQATNATGSNFFGSLAGYEATGATYSNFIGNGAGYQATNASTSNFFGRNAGFGANSASYSNLFGYNVGNSLGIGSNNIIIGTNISLPSLTTNSINIGGVLFGANTYEITTGIPSISAQTTGRIGINVVNPSEALHVSGNTLINGNLTATTISATTYLNLPSSIFTGGTVSGQTTFTNGLSASTFSATTYLNLPLDIRVTGGTYSTGTAVFTNNTGGTFSVTGFSTSTGGGETFTGGTVTGPTTFTNGLTANTISATTIEGGDLDFMMVSLFRTLYNY